MFKYHALVEYFTGDDNGLMSRKDTTEYTEEFVGRHSGLGEKKSAYQFVGRLQKLFKSFKKTYGPS